MNTPSFQKTKRIISTSLVGCLLLIALYGLFFYYISYLNNEAATLKVAVAEFKSAEEERSVVEKTFQETAENRNRIDSFFVGSQKEEEVNFVSLLENLATETAKVDLEISSLKHEQLGAVKSDKVEYLVVQAKVRGSFSDAYYFLRLLESFPKGVVVRQVDMEAIPGDPKKPSEWQLSFILQALKVK